MPRPVAIPAAPLPPPNPDLEAFLGAEPKKRKKGLRGIGPTDMGVATEEALMMRAKNQWHAARAIHFVALFRELHQGVYGIPAHDLDQSRTRKLAVLAAGRFIADTFRGDPYSFSVFFWWAWEREENREKWRMQNGKSGSHLTWRRLFAVTGSDYTEWRLEIRRRGLGLPPAFQHDPVSEDDGS